MKKTLLAFAVVLTASQVASAATLLIPDGGFQGPGPTGFTQTISGWSVSLTGTPNAAYPTSEQSGIFSSLGKFTVAPQGNQFAFLSNLGGTGVVTLTSGTLANPAFLVSDRRLEFQYAYFTNDAPGAFAHDRFRVHIDFFNDAAAANFIGSLDQDFTRVATNTDTGIGISPMNSSTPVYNDSLAAPTTFNHTSIELAQFFGSFARISFIVDSSGPTSGPNMSGNGVTGIVLDNILLTPEPSTVALFAFGAMGLGGFVWRRRNAAKKPAA
jgi:hypothetical protein